MSTGSPSGIRIGRLVTRNVSEGETATQLRLEAGLGAVDLHRTGLPPDAILCVRNLSDPAPRRFRVRHANISPPVEWLLAVERRIEELWRHAARPACELVPSSAEAVVFLDRIELLTAVAAAWADGDNLSDWWWRRLLPSGSPRESVLKMWHAEAASIPAALGQLASSRVLLPFVMRLEEGDVVRLTESLMHTYGLTSTAGYRVSDHEEQAAPIPAAEPPWSTVAPELADKAIPPTTAHFTGIGLTMARRPALARSAGFMSACDLWLQRSSTAWTRARTTSRHDPSDTAQTPLSGTTTWNGVDETVPVWVSLHQANQTEQASAASTSPADSIAPSFVADRDQQADQSERETVPEIVPTASGAPPSITEAVAQQSPPATEEQIAPEFNSQPVEPLRASNGSPEAAAPADYGAPAEFTMATVDHSIYSRYGGMLFLANVALSLGLYPDFTGPSEQGLRMEFWAFMLGLAKRLLGETPVDPLWTKLQSIAGEEDDQPLPAPDAWRIPKERIVSSSPLRGWPDWWTSAIPYIRDRLTMALGLPEERDPARLLICQPATVRMTPVSIHAVFAMERHPIEIRLAGLDRDPGWIPAAGRAITFGFDVTAA